MNQRGQDSYTGNSVYSIDRWLINGTLTLSNGIQVSGHLDQRLPLLNEVRGKQLTFSALDTAGNLKTVTGAFPAEFSGVAEVVSNDALHIGYDARPGFNFVFVLLMDGNWIAVKLELGDTQTLAHQEGGQWILNEVPSYADQLATCQRYFLRMQAPISNVNFGLFLPFSTERAYGVINLPCTMRTRPTMTLTGSFQLSLGMKAVDSINYWHTLGDKVAVVLASSGLAKGTTYYLENTTTPAYIDFSADL